MLLIIEKRIRGEICHAIHHYTKANNKYTKPLIKTKNHYILCTWMQTIYMDEQCLKNYLYAILIGEKHIKNLMRVL